MNIHIRTKFKYVTENIGNQKANFKIINSTPDLNQLTSTGPSFGASGINALLILIVSHLKAEYGLSPVFSHLGDNWIHFNLTFRAEETYNNEKKLYTLSLNKAPVEMEHLIGEGESYGAAERDLNSKLKEYIKTAFQFNIYE